MKVVHLTSAHPRYDTRIFLKECRSLAVAGHQVSLVVADGLGKEERDGVRIYDAGIVKGRVNRIAFAARRVAQLALMLDADVYHLHDPELLLFALDIKAKGKRVIFDSHEDVGQDILTKPYLPGPVRALVSKTFTSFERYVCRRIDHVVAATSVIRDKFGQAGISATSIRNYPIVGEFEPVSDWSGKQRQICYIGSIAEIRGIRELVAALALCEPPVRLQLAGEFGESGLREAVMADPGWRHVDELGQLSREQVGQVLARCMAGAVTLHPTQAYKDSLPIKMFEYMAAGIPVIASNFSTWIDIVEVEKCGVCVDPLDPSAIARSIVSLLGNLNIAKEMGSAGAVAVRSKFLWTKEAEALAKLYRTLEG